MTLTDDEHCCPVIELRRYTLHPGGRDVLVDLFERELIEPQEAVGMRLIGQFHDANDPDQFVFLRGFADMATRHAALESFYTGPVWRRHREIANATMIRSDNVLLLRPARPGWGFPATRVPGGGAESKSSSLVRPVVATICLLDSPGGDDLFDLIDSELRPALSRARAELIACLVTEPSPNTYPDLPVREGVRALVWLTRGAGGGGSGNPDDVASWSLPAGANRLAAAVSARLVEPTETLVLWPTPRSAIRG
jgi:hypothetical protein